MEQLYTTKVTRVGTSKGIVIPIDIINGLGWQRGDTVLFTFAADDKLIVKRIDNETIKKLKRDSGLYDLPTIE